MTLDLINVLKIFPKKLLYLNSADCTELMDEVICAEIVDFRRIFRVSRESVRKFLLSKVLTVNQYTKRYRSLPQYLDLSGQL